MTPVEKGRFCASCQKKVFDFTHSSDREIAIAFKQNEELCGRFLNTQLNRELVVPKEKSSIWMAASAAVISFLGLNPDTVTAQEIKTEQTENIIEVPIIGDTIIVKPKHRISGTITDGEGHALEGVSITIENKTLCSLTNTEGKFSFEAEDGDQINIYSFPETSISINRDSQWPETIKVKIWMAKESTMQGLIATIYKRRTFFGRIFHSIGNIFRKNE